MASADGGVINTSFSIVSCSRQGLRGGSRGIAGVSVGWFCLIFVAINPAKKSRYPSIAALVAIKHTGINKASKAEIAVAKVVVIPKTRMVTNPIAAGFCANFIA